MKKTSQEHLSDIAICDSCGEHLPPNATFCPNCGSRKISRAGSSDAEMPYQYGYIDSSSSSRRVVSAGGGYRHSHRSFRDYAGNDYADGDGEEIQYSREESYEAGGGGEYADRECRDAAIPAEDDADGEYYGEEYPDMDYDENAEYEDDGSDEDDYQRYIYTSLRSRLKGLPRMKGRAAKKNHVEYSMTQAVGMTVAVGFLAVVILVALTGLIISLFSGDGSDSVTVEPTNVSSDASTEKAETGTTQKSKLLHLLPDEVKNTKYERFTLEDNLFSVAMASSYIKSGNLTSGSTGRAFDGDPKTCWQDGVEGYGEGEWLLAYNSDGIAVKVSSVTVYNGYQNTKYNTSKKDMYLYNSRVKAFTLEFDDSTTESFELEDDKDAQTFDFKERTTCYVRFTIDDVYKGSKYKDTCIGEIVY